MPKSTRSQLEEDARRVESDPILLAYVIGVRDAILAEKKKKEELRKKKKRKKGNE